MRNVRFNEILNFIACVPVNNLPASPVHGHVHCLTSPSTHTTPRPIPLRNLSLPRGQRASPPPPSLLIWFSDSSLSSTRSGMTLPRHPSHCQSASSYLTHFNAFYLLCKSSSVLLPKKRGSKQRRGEGEGKKRKVALYSRGLLLLLRLLIKAIYEAQSAEMNC